MTPLLDLLVDNEDVLKVFHAGGQDLEIVYNLTGKTPHPLFDTQIAAMAMGQGEQIGYSNLVESDAGHQARQGRPLHRLGPPPARQAPDRPMPSATSLTSPRYSRGCSKSFARPAAAAGSTMKWSGWAIPAATPNLPELAWTRVRLPSRKAEVLGRLKAIAAWREREARSKNLPRGRIAKDETIADLASHPPREQGDLAKVRGLSPSWAGNDIGARLIAAIQESEPLSEAEMPPREDRRPGLGKEGALIADLLKLLLKVRSRDADVAPRLIARADDLELLAAGVRDLPLLQGWRNEIFGKDALALVEGRLAFSVRSGKMVMSEIKSVSDG